MRLPPKPLATAKHAEERLKLATSGLQALALTVTGAAIIAPLFNVTASLPLWVRIGRSSRSHWQRLLLSSFCAIFLSHPPAKETGNV